MVRLRFDLQFLFFPLIFSFLSVHGVIYNVAKKKSTYPTTNTQLEELVDGNIEKSFLFQGSINSNWIKIDLGKSFHILYVILFLKESDSKNLSIEVYNKDNETSFYNLCKKKVFLDNSKIFQCDKMSKYQFVKLTVHSETFEIYLKEIEVYAEVILSETNLALFKNVISSSNDLNFCFDGDFTSVCLLQGHKTIQIDLDNKFIIKKVIFYSFKYENMTVKISSGNKEESCVYDGDKNIETTFVCNSNNESRFIYIMLMKDKNVSEIQVFGDKENETTFVGCYKYLNSFKKLEGNLTLKECCMKCRIINKDFCFLKENSCLCSSTLPYTDLTRDSCFSNQENLKKQHSLSAFHTFAEKSLSSFFIGCVNIVNTNITYNLKTDLSICTKYCSYAGFNKFFFKDKGCSCSYNFKALGFSKACDSTDETQFPVYKICHKNEPYWNDCLEEFKCSNELYLNFNGKLSCSDNLCKKGWKGDMCTERNCSDANGGCNSHECFIFNNISECKCSFGFYKLNTKSFCTKNIFLFACLKVSVLLLVLILVTILVAVIKFSYFKRKKNISEQPNFDSIYDNLNQVNSCSMNYQYIPARQI